ncbi:unnamed protein product [Symbiodinium sp. CCMP2592]|nr:unnamed protein product [Symbiodinium sp. CCMP2592]
MDLLVAYETGTVELVELSWPPGLEEGVPQICVGYVIMKRPSGFLLCVPEGFMSQVELENGQAAMELEGVGPSIVIRAPPVQLAASGDWVTAPEGEEEVPALLVDLAAPLAEQISPVDLLAPDLVLFRPGQAMIFPLASDVLRQAREWLTTDPFPAERGGYHTAQSAPEGPSPGKARQAKPKRPTVQQLATQQEKMMELMASLVGRLDALAPPAPAQVAPAASEAPAPQPAAPHAVLSRPLASVLPPFQSAPKSLASVVGPPPPARAQPPAAAQQPDKEEQANAHLEAGDLPPVESGNSSLASAVLAQSQALVALVSQMSQGVTDPLLEGQPGQSTSVRGSVGRAKLQQELAARTGAFADRVRENMTRRMDPTGLLAEDQVSFLRFLERHGGYANQQLLGLIAWQLAQCLDLLHIGSTDGARDALSLLLVMVEQVARDRGSPTLGWLLTLQADPPLGLFQPQAAMPGSQIQSFTPLCDQRWITVALAYTKELETIAGRVSESSAKPPPPKGPKPPTLPPPADPATEEQQLTKKQQRAAQWDGFDLGEVPGTVFPLEGAAVDEESGFSFVAWISALPRLLHSGRTQFSRFLLSTMRVCEGPLLAPTSALFPLPLLREGIFQKRARRNAPASLRLAVERCVHFVSMGLNYMHAGCRPVPVHSLRRRLNPLQAQAYDRIEVLVWACARQAGHVPSCAGRRGLHLATRLSEVLSYCKRLGLDAGPYGADSALPEGAVCEPPEHVSGDGGKGTAEALQPYRSIRADQVVLHGKGLWDLSRHLGPDLYLPYVEPEVYRFSGSGAPCATFASEDKAEVFRLCKLWDASGLLGLTPGPLPERLCARVFGAYKGPGQQRQIGDRRGQNSLECQLVGPSRFLPVGPLLCRVHVPSGSCLVGSVTDRRDFYTQASVSKERALTNAVGPALPLDWFAGTSAFDDLLADPSRHTVDPDLYAGALRFDRPSLLCDRKPYVHPTFKALFQGDAGGVEFATAGHEGLLHSYGCLRGPGRLQSKHPVAPNGPWQGLIIDDFFALSVEPCDFVEGAPCRSSELIAQAKAGYSAEGVIGSDSKDILSSRAFKVAGAEVDSTSATVGAGATLCGYPVHKRLALAAASVRAAQCPCLSEELVSCLSGSWVSCLMYRRCLTSVLDGLFGLGRSSSAGGAPGSTLRPLSRKVAGELQLLAVLAPVAVCNLSAAPSEEVFATDASMQRGAVCATPVRPDASLGLWLSLDVKGAPVHLSTPGALGKLGGSAGQTDFEDSLPPDHLTGEPPTVQKPLAFRFDFLEVGVCSGIVSACLASRGYSVGPLVDFARSPHYDLASPRLREWLLHLIGTGRLRSIALCPPASSFRPFGRFLLRSWTCPLGFDPRHPTVLKQNTIAAVCFAVLWGCARYRVPAVLVHPASSLLPQLPGWAYLRDKIGLIDSKARDPWGFARAGCRALVSGISPPVGSRFVEPPGLQQPAAKGVLCCPRLAFSLAGAFAGALDPGGPAGPELCPTGLENIIANDLLLAAPWSVVADWPWRRISHINVLETKAVLKAIQLVIKEGGNRKVPLLLDSAVARGAIAKGRSSSRLLRPVLLRISASLVAGGVYVAMGHAPTRLNVADDPTRCTLLRKASGQLLSDLLAGDSFLQACRVSGLSSACAGWYRLSLLLSFRTSRAWGLDLLGVLGQPFRAEWPASAAAPVAAEQSAFNASRLFDATLGFPGEGPLEPRNAKDALRRRARQGETLPEGRPVQLRTSANRSSLLKAFQDWLLAGGLEAEGYLSWPAEEIGRVLAVFGRELFEAGYPYWHLAETINAIASKRPAVRRQLQAAWDVAFSWMAAEPHSHHVAMPAVVLLAVLAVSLLWGWRSEAGIFGLAWGALLRIGEAVGARRECLVLPRDVLGSQTYVLLRIEEPKTRYRAARQQAGKLEQADLVELVDLAFAKLPPYSRLWPMTAQTLRRRLDAVLEALSIPTARGTTRPLDLGSFRPGGATHMLQITEDSELVRRRGRWVSPKVMEIYLQEIASQTFFPALPLATRNKVMQAAACFPELLRRARQWTQNGVPTGSWFYLWSFQSVATGKGD